MDAPTRVLKAVNHEEADRVPAFESSFTNNTIMAHYGVQSSGGLTGGIEAIKNLQQRATGAIATRYDIQIGSYILTSPPTFEAYQEYLRGLELFGKDYAQCYAHLNKATEIDPAFLLPKAFIATGYSNQGDYEKAKERGLFMTLCPKLVKDAFIEFRKDLHDIKPFTDQKIYNDDYFRNVISSFEGNHMSFHIPPIQILEACITDTRYKPIYKLQTRSLKCVDSICDLFN
jgi:hypothetical protein